MYSNVISYIRNYRKEETLCLNAEYSIIDCVRVFNIWFNMFLCLSSFVVLSLFLQKSIDYSIICNEDVISFTIMIISFTAFTNEIPFLYNNRYYYKEYSQIHDLKNRICYILIVYVMYFILLLFFLRVNINTFNQTFFECIFLFLLIPLSYILYKKYKQLKINSFSFIREGIDLYFKNKYGKLDIDEDSIIRVINNYLNLLYIVHVNSTKKQYTFNESVLMCCIGHIEWHVKSGLNKIDDFKVGKVLKIYVNEDCNER